MNRMTASTVRPGALTAATRPMATCVAAPTTAAPASGEHQQEGAEYLGDQAAPLKGRILEALHPPRVTRKMPKPERPLSVEAGAGAAVLGGGAQLDQSNLPGTCASSSTR